MKLRRRIPCSGFRFILYLQTIQNKNENCLAENKYVYLLTSLCK